MMFRNSVGARQTTKNVLVWTQGMPRGKDAKSSMQNPLNLRAIPQVHGAILDELNQIHQILKTELTGISDNPMIVGTPQMFSQASAVGAAIACASE